MEVTIIEKEIFEARQDYTVGEWLDIWFAVYTTGLKESTVGIYRDARRRISRAFPALEQMPVEQLRPAVFQQMLNGLEEKYAKSSIQHVRTLYNKAFRAAVQNHICTWNPIVDSQVPKMASVKVVEGLTLEEQRAFEAVLHQLPVVDHFLLQTYLLTGLRRNELLDLQWEDWNQEKNVLFIRQSKTVSGVRSVPVVPEVAAMFCHLLLRSRQLMKPSPYIFCIGGRRIGKDHLRHVCAHAARLAGIRHVTPHMLRHTFASRMIENGADPKSLSRIIGHANVAFTLHRYVSVDDSHLAQQMLLISKGR